MCAFSPIVLYTCFVLSHCVTIHRIDQVDIISKNRVELSPVEIPTILNDIVVISAPIVHNAQYYIYKPSGEAIKLNISKPTYSTSNENIINDIYDSIIITYSKHIKSIIPINDYRVFNLEEYLNDTETSTTINNTFEEYEHKMNANDFMIGPLREEDHGNWVLSAYTQEKNGDWNEIFRVITIKITETIQPKPIIAKLREGDTFEFSFAYPVTHITSCELSAPRSTFDRFYERDSINMGSCGYLIPNITNKDQGTWKIIGIYIAMYCGVYCLQSTRYMDSKKSYFFKTQHFPPFLQNLIKGIKF